MQIQIHITPDTTTQNLIALSHALLALAGDPNSQASEKAQPEVAQNTGSLGSVPAAAHDRSPSEAQSEEQEGATSPAPVKRGRKLKSSTGESALNVAQEATSTGADDPTQNEDPAETTLNTQGSGTVASPAESSPLTLDTVRAALQSYVAVHGVESGLQILSKYNASRMTELAPEHYAAFVGEIAV